MAQNAVPIAIRLDGDSAAKLIEQFDKDGGAYFIVKELEGSNPHYHAVLHSVRKLAAVRQGIKRAMPELNGNGSYSVTLVKDIAKYERYMCKGESDGVLPMVVAAHGMTYTSQEWLKETHDAYWTENAEINRKRKKAPIVDAVLAKCKEAKYNWQDRELIARVYIRELAARDKSINIFATKASVNLIQVKLCPDDSALESLARDV